MFRRLPKDDIADALPGRRVVGRPNVRRSNNQIRQTISIDVASPRDTVANTVVRRRANDPETKLLDILQSQVFGHRHRRKPSQRQSHSLHKVTQPPTSGSCSLSI